MWLEFNSPDDCKLYGPKGEIPILAPGENEISFSGRGSQGINSRVQVTVISEGVSLGAK